MKVPIRGRKFLGLARDSAVFGLSPALAAASPILVLPLIVGTFGLDAWTAIAVGQAMGFFAASVVEYGWPIAATKILDSRSSFERAVAYKESVYARVVLTVPTVGGLALVCLFVIDQSVVVGTLSAIATALSGLGATWFYAGVGKPASLLIRESIPRILSTPVGAILAVIAGNLVVMPLVQISTAVIALLWVSVEPWSIASGSRVSRADIVGAIRSQFGVGIVRVATTAMYTLPVGIVAAVAAPNFAAVFAGYDRLEKLAITAAVPTLQALQSRLIRPRTGVVSYSNKAGLCMIVALAAATGTAFYIFSPVALGYLFAGQIEVSTTLTSAFSVISALAVLSRGIQLVFVGRSLSLASAGILVMLVGIGLMGVFIGAGLNVDAVAWAVLFGEFLILGPVLFELSKLKARSQYASRGSSGDRGDAECD